MCLSGSTSSGILVYCILWGEFGRVSQRKLLFAKSSLGTLLTVGLVFSGWVGVVLQGRKLEASTIETYQNAQLEVVRNAARASQVYIYKELDRRGLAELNQIEQEVLRHFVQPIRIGTVGDAWIYSPDYVVFDQSEDFPAEYRGKSMAEIFALQQEQGARHFDAMTTSVMASQEGVGWYIWEPDKARESTAWWEFLTRDAGIEIAAWSPISVTSNNGQSQMWVLGMSAMLPELMQLNGAYGHIHASILTMSIATLGALLLLMKLRGQEQALRHSVTQYYGIIEDQTDRITRFSQDGTLTFVNRAYAQSRGKQANSLLGTSIFEQIPEPEKTVVRNHLTHLTPDHPVGSIEYRSVASDCTECTERWQSWTARLLVDDQGKTIGFQSVGRDITQQKQQAAKIEQLAYTDFLTGLPNRRQLYRVGIQTLQALSKSGLEDVTAAPSQVALLYLDLNEFKQVNDTLGHDVGDALLIELGKRLKLCLREQDLLARLGGDEFAIWLSPTDKKTVIGISERMMSSLQAPFYIQGQSIHVGASLGIAMHQPANIAFSTLLTQADIAMYQAKAKGNYEWVIFNAAMQAAVISRSATEKELRLALGRQELRLYYQPIIDLTTSQISGFEALVRWQHPHRGLLSPGCFLPILTDMGLAHWLDCWVLRQACQQLAKWQAVHRNGPRPTLSVNLHSSHFSDPGLLPFVEDLLQTTSVNPQQLTLEITEESMIQQPEAVMDVLCRLRQMGLRISLDDFGTGYSSLNYLHQFPVDILKIDRSFISPIPVTASNETVVSSIIELAHKLNIATVAEGIETPQQLMCLQAMRCHYGQGYHFSKPLSLQAADQLLEHAVCLSFRAGRSGEQVNQ